MIYIKIEKMKTSKRIYHKMLCMVVISMLGSARAAAISTPAGSALTMSYDHVKDLVEFKATVKANMYFSVGFGRTMKDCDMVVFQGQGASGLVTDRWSVGYGVPMLDIVQDYESSGSLKGDTY